MRTIHSLRTSSHVPVATRRLRIGAVLQHPMLEEDSSRNTCLLPAGATITKSLVRVLEDKGVRRVRIEWDDVPTATVDSRDRSAQLEAARERAARVAELEQGNPWTINAESFLHEIRRHGTSPYDRRDRDEFAFRVSKTIGRVSDAFGSLSSGFAPESGELVATTAEAIDLVTRDADLFIALGLDDLGDGYPTRHAVQAAMVAIAVGTHLGLRRGELLELGLGCLVHDVGMLHLDQRIVNSPDRLDDLAFLEITKHPIITYDLLQNVDMPIGARMVAYQMHERCDGSGYPKGRKDRQIHPLARIAAVADVFVALSSPRPYRPAMRPYEAVVELLDGVRRGLYDRFAVRGLLRAVSLFPIGSGVETTDGRVGRVLRSTSDYTRPVVELRTAEGVDVVDLTSLEGIRVAKAIDVSDIIVPAAAPRDDGRPSPLPSSPLAPEGTRNGVPEEDEEEMEPDSDEVLADFWE